MTMLRVAAVLLLVVAACTNQTEGTTSSVPGASTTTTLPEAPPGVDLEPFALGLIGTERGAIGQLVGTAPFYQMDLSLSADLTRISGMETVTYTNAEDVDLEAVVFRLFPNIADGESKVTNVEVDGQSTRPQLELEDSVLRIPLPRPLAPGEEITIAMDIAVTVPTEEGGNYGTFLLDQDILAAAHFYPILAVYDDEGWNTEIPSPNGDVVYSDIGFYQVTIAAPDILPIVTSGQLVAKEAPGPDGVGSRTFVAGPVRDFYLAASQRFDLTQGRVGDTIVNSYAPAEFAVQSREVVRLAESALELFDSLYGPYPYSEFDIVGTSTLALGIEYPGVIALNMGHFDPEAGLDSATIASTVVHEVAHQWFYALVGNDQLDEPWLDEAMAQYATWTYWRLTQGEGGDTGFRQHLESRWARVEFADIPIGLPVASYDGQEYSAIVYGRGPLFLADLADSMGRETFDAFLADYVARFKYGISTTVDFETLAAEDCGCDLSPMFAAAVDPR